MACGLPVICRDAGGCNEVVRHYETGFLVNDARPDCTLYEALNLLEQKPEMYFRFAAQAHAIIGSRFSYEAMVEQTERLLQKVCDN
jgi:glycosyltransferase involved in cell wall biosynthesis